MSKPRPPAHEELPKVVQFLNHQLRPQNSWSITSEYPQAFSPNNISNIRIIEQDNEIVSHAVLKNLMIKSPAGLFKAAAIGNVVTAEAYRNKGYSTQIVESCLELARQHSCDIAILWTDKYGFYQRMGFDLAGQEIGIVLEEDVHSDEFPVDLKIVEGSNIDANALLRLYAQHTVGTLRTAQDVSHYLKIPQARLFSAWDKDNQLQAYAVMGRGADLINYIHEWGGGVSKLIPLLAHIRKINQQPVTIILPAHAQNLIRRLREFRVTYNEGYLGMIKIIEPRHLILKIQRYARALGWDQLTIGADKDGLRIGYGTDVFTVETESAMTRLIFGPDPLQSLVGVTGPTLRFLEKVFPLPFWVWGWDSV